MDEEGTKKGAQEGLFDWRRGMREHRSRLGLSLVEVARRSGLSQSAVKAYENGRRHPSREALIAIIDALGLTGEQASPLLAGAGYASNWRAIFNDAYGPFDIGWFAAEVERSEWPVMVTNEASDIMAANRAVRRILRIPAGESLPQPEKWNFVSLANQPWYVERLENWDEAWSFAAGLAKTGLRRQVNPERPAPWAEAAYRRFLGGDPALVTRMLKLWEPAEPVAHTTRMHYRVRWRHDNGGLMRFTAVMHVADVWQVFAWHDWVPEDEETLRLLRQG